jgi:geranylgeranyl diphosphate synthase, type I
MDYAHRMLFEEMGGQLSDIAASMAGKRAPSLEQLLNICRYKTACYTFETPLQIGAVLAGADDDTIFHLATFGRALGVAFQLADDMLGVYGDEAVTGKPILSDMQEGKQTVLIHYALSRATARQTDALRRVWGHPDSSHKELEVARKLIAETGAREQVKKLIRKYFDDGLRALEAASLTLDAKTELTRIAHFSIERQY